MVFWVWVPTRAIRGQNKPKIAICGHFGPKVALRGILTPHKTFDPGPNYLIPMWAPSENPLGATFILEKIRKAIFEIEYPPPADLVLKEKKVGQRSK